MRPVVVLFAGLFLAVSSVWASIHMDTPACQSAQAQMRDRFPLLRPYFSSGVLGLTRLGMVELRTPQILSPADRHLVVGWVQKENAARTRLYREVARANGHREWKVAMQVVFARAWVQKMPQGWWYEDLSGTWRQKSAPVTAKETAW